MMKKLLALALLALLCLAPLAVRADVIWIPEDDFLTAHLEECDYLEDRYVTVRETEGYASPQDARPAYTLSPGAELFISHGYTDRQGETWGLYEGGGMTMWIPLSTLEKVYDDEDFQRDHADRIAPYADEMADAAIENTLYLWTYPGSGEIGGKLPAEAFDGLDFSPYDLVYTDDAGGVWAHISYLWGSSGWVYAPDPENPRPASESVPAPQTPSPADAPRSTPVITTLPAQPHLTQTVGVIAGVVGVAALSAALLAMFYLRKKK